MKHAQKYQAKKSTKNSKFECGRKFNKESKQKESTSNKCKASNTLIIFENANTRTKETKALTTCANFLTHPKNELHPH
jgi:hypothetical protein